mmetsp:Transcript_137233/g.347643  ORF Transcript_137233/g.347643 Transcript_137233/m.347643 type:complete len:223 (+) Transcript_137233:1354-2022(+)
MSAIEARGIEVATNAPWGITGRAIEVACATCEARDLSAREGKRAGLASASAALCLPHGIKVTGEAGGAHRLWPIAAHDATNMSSCKLLGNARRSCRVCRDALARQQCRAEHRGIVRRNALAAEGSEARLLKARFRSGPYCRVWPHSCFQECQGLCLQRFAPSAEQGSNTVVSNPNKVRVIKLGLAVWRHPCCHDEEANATCINVDWCCGITPRCCRGLLPRW